MSNLFDKWNKAKFNVYDSEEKTVLKLLTNLSNFIGELTGEVDKKTDLNGDHKGSWQGLNRPTLSEEGMRATVENLDGKVKLFDKKGLVFNGSYKDLKDLLENCPNVSEKGGVIYLPSGIIEIEPFELGDRIILKGCGTGATILKQKGNTTGDFITVSNNNNFSAIYDLTIDGNLENNLNGGNGVIIKSAPTWSTHDINLVINKLIKKADTYSHFNMDNVIVRNNRMNGIKIEQIRYAININNVHSVKNEEFGIYNLSTDNMFSNLYLEKNGCGGLYEEGKNNKWSIIKAIWNGEKNRTYGGVFIKGNNNTFIGVESQDNYTHGFRLNVGGGNTLIGCLADANGYLDYDTTTNAHYGFFIDLSYNNDLIGCTVANYREKPFMKKPYVITGHSNNIDIKVHDNSCIDMLPDIGNANNGTKNFTNSEQRYYIDNLGIRHIYMNCYFEVTNTAPMTKVFPLPINFENILSCTSEVLSINSGELYDHHYKLSHSAEVFEEGGQKKIRVSTKSEDSIPGVWAINIHVRIEGY